MSTKILKKQTEKNKIGKETGKEKIILISNIGSMSRKYFVYTIDSKKEIRELFNICFDKKEYHKEVQDLDEAILKFFEIAKREYGFSISDIDVIAERVVAVGEYFLEHRVIDEKYLESLEKAKRYDVIHTEDLIKEIKKIILMKEVAKKNKIKTKFKLVGISDSEFHKTIEKENYVYAINDDSFRRYGYHGISMSEIVHATPSAGLPAASPRKQIQVKQIAIHLGGGGSVTAIQNGKSIWNSFGMTPVGGIVNMTRSGDIDPFVALEIFNKNKKYFSLLEGEEYQFENTKKEIYEMSGMYALSGEKDMRDILENLKSKDKSKKERAEFAIEVYTNRIAEKVGSAFALLGGCDDLIFTGSILEKSEVVRKRLLKKLSWLNLQNDFSLENVKVIKTEEEREMVRLVAKNF